MFVEAAFVVESFDEDIKGCGCGAGFIGRFKHGGVLAGPLRTVPRAPPSPNGIGDIGMK